MTELRRCERCGATRSVDGSCPGCLLHLGFDEPAVETALIAPEPSGDDGPRQIGRYRILGILGEGGMGVVYEAEQENPRRRVAVKVVRGGQFIDESRVKMFQREADTLARLKHPNIAGIHEAGRTDGGQHFFAMELVRGEPLDVHMKQRPEAVAPTELRFRLALFRKIADAVHYAHQRGVIHRDLKPSNIVVTEEATREESVGTTGSAMTSLRLPEIKILDFGLARITDGDVAAATMTTEVGVIKGTLPYMSPEQARGNPDQIDVRTDVYALGVILYEMLTGRRPYDVLKKSLAEAVRVICEEPPLSVSQALAGTRRLDPDIETIVGKALEKGPERRYASAAALSDDIARYLGSQPIMARPPSTIYQLRKFAKRNRVLVGGVGTVLVVLLAGVVVSTTQYIRAEASRRQAEASRDDALVEKAKAEAVNRFLQDVLGSANPFKAKGEEITVRQALDEAAGKIDTAFGEQPLIEAAVRLTIGRTYRELGDYASSETHLREAVRLYKEHLGENHPEVMDGLFSLGGLLAHMGKFAETEELHRLVVESRRERLGEEHPRTLEAAYGLGHALWALGQYAESERTHRKVLEIQRRVLGEEHVDTVWSIHNLGIVLRDLGRREEAEELFREGLEISRRIVGHKSPLTLELTSQLGELLTLQDRLVEAEPLLREALNSRLEVLGENHRSTAETLLCLGELHRRRGELAEAESLIRRAVEVNQRVETRNFLWASESLIHVLLARGKVEEARPVWVSVRERLHEKAEGPEADAGSMNRYAWSLLTAERDEWQDAETALSYARRAVASPDGEEATFLDTLALAYFRTGDTARAIETQEQAIALLRPTDTSLRERLETRLAEYRDSLKDP